MRFGTPSPDASEVCDGFARGLHGGIIGAEAGRGHRYSSCRNGGKEVSFRTRSQSAKYKPNINVGFAGFDILGRAMILHGEEGNEKNPKRMSNTLVDREKSRHSLSDEKRITGPEGILYAFIEVQLYGTRNLVILKRLLMRPGSMDSRQ